MTDLRNYLKNKTYPGRGLVFYKVSDEKLVAAYWIMGRSSNSRNRVFQEITDGDYAGLGVRTLAADDVLCEDPHLIIYNASLDVVEKGITIITNGDQTDTIYEALNSSDSTNEAFQSSLFTRTFEDDAPNFTPRISMMIDTRKGGVAMSILKCADPSTQAASRFFYFYDDVPAGEGRLITTYVDDGNPLPSFDSEPIKITGDIACINCLQNAIWESLNKDNKISLLCYEFDLKTGKQTRSIMNKYERVSA